ncbi:hypothetical protein HPP92_002073 [Vanilla planifolia]|uniref:FLZ-type domain-containing protein n=1 Tax=Vanilla planifolia TaxID=51239 RepID=A0A835VMF5_VANPL|nr:hypothetical protein HPP92_002073 [Vanilla planifolia]
MLLGKRQRQPMRRTTSMAGFAADLGVTEELPKPSDLQIPAIVPVNQQPQNRMGTNPGDKGDFTADWLRNINKSSSSTVAAAVHVVSPRITQRRSVDLAVVAEVETAPFLRACGLCSRRLSPGRDIFMYRGEIAFCSLECRQQQINLDERKAKCSLSSISTKDSISETSTSAEPSGTGKTVAAA